MRSVCFPKTYVPHLVDFSFSLSRRCMPYFLGETEWAMVLLFAGAIILFHCSFANILLICGCFMSHCTEDGRHVVITTCFTPFYFGALRGIKYSRCYLSKEFEPCYLSFSSLQRNLPWPFATVNDIFLWSSRAQDSMLSCGVEACYIFLISVVLSLTIICYLILCVSEAPDPWAIVMWELLISATSSK